MLALAHRGLEHQALVIVDMVANLSAKRREAFQMYCQHSRGIVNSETLFSHDSFFAPSAESLSETRHNSYPGHSLLAFVFV